LSITTLRRHAGRALAGVVITAVAFTALTGPSQAAEDTGTITGRIVNVAGAPLAFAEVTPYGLVADPLDGPQPNWTDFSTDEDGRFSVPISSDGMKLRFSQDNGGFFTTWFGGTSWETATTFAPNPGEVTDIGDVMLNADIYIDEDGAGPRVKGQAKLGSTVSAQKADWRPHAVTRTYQWYYVKSGVRVRLPGATHYYYKITSSTLLGKNLQFLETASYPGATSKSVFSPSVRVVRPSYVTASLTSPSRGKVKVKVGLKVSGISKPDAKVKVRYANLYTATLPASQWPYKWVSVKDGVGSVTISGFMPTSTAKIRVELAATSTYASDSASKSITVHK